MQRVELDLEHEFSAVIKDDLLNLNCLAVSISTPPPPPRMGNCLIITYIHENIKKPTKQPQHLFTGEICVQQLSILPCSTVHYSLLQLSGFYT